MNRTEFDNLYELKSMIDDYESEIDTIETYFEDKNPSQILFFTLSLRHGLAENGTEIQKYAMMGSGSHDTNSTHYGHNARIMNAAIKAMKKEMQTVLAEIDNEFSKKLQNH